MDITLLEQLTQAYGPCGYELEIRTVLSEAVRPYADEVYKDRMGTLVAIKRGRSSEKKVIVLTHMDEPGFIVNRVEDGGFLRISAAGDSSIMAALYQRVIFENGAVGAIAMDGSNFLGYHKDVEPQDIEQEKLYVDIAVANKEEAEKLVNVGDYCTFYGPFSKCGGNKAVSKALDNRAGCATAIDVLRRLKDAPPAYDTYFAFTILGKAHKLGAKAITTAIAPDFALSIDTTPATDCPEQEEGNKISLGGGPVIKHMDESTFVMPGTVHYMVDKAEKLGIRIQHEVKNLGSNELWPVYMSMTGVPAASIMIPIRYARTCNEMVSLDDMDAASCYAAAVLCDEGLLN